MQHAKKMLLVEPELIERFKTNNESAPENSLSRLDSEMQRILNSKIGDREKWALYSQALQRYLHVTEEGRKPLKLSILTNIEDELTKGHNVVAPYVEEKYNDPVTFTKTTSTDEVITPTNKETFTTKYTPSYILKLFPKTYKKKGHVLLDLIIQNKPRIWWKEGGEVVVNDETLNGSNIFDLVSDVVRPLKRPKPLGWEKFTTALKDIRVPLSYIGNPTSLEYINQLNLKELQSHKEKEANTSTPVSSKSNESSKRKINWERWTPY